MIIILHNIKPEDIIYPTSKKDLVVDSYHDTTIVDPYRWLEKESSKETKAWIVKQNSVTDSYMRRIRDIRKIKNRLKEIWIILTEVFPFKRAVEFIISITQVYKTNQF